MRFQSARAARPLLQHGRARGRVSIRARRAARDLALCSSCCSLRSFNPRAPRDKERLSRRNVWRCFNPRAPRGARRSRSSIGGARDGVSIRARRAARDEATSAFSRHRADVSIRARRAARDPRSDRLFDIWIEVSIRARRAARDNGGAYRGRCRSKFQSARAARRATLRHPRIMEVYAGFNPRAPRGARRSCRLQWPKTSAVSIRARRAARDIDS